MGGGTSQSTIWVEAHHKALDLNNTPSIIRSPQLPCPQHHFPYTPVPSAHKVFNSTYFHVCKVCLDLPHGGKCFS